MKRLFRLIIWGAVICAVVWLLRERLVPAPETAREEPPHYRVAPPPPPAPPPAAEPAAAEPDDLEAIKGVGPVYAARLSEAGISTYSALAAADADGLAEMLGVRSDQTADWIDQASTLAG